MPIAGVLPDPPDDPVDRFADVTNERLKRAEYLVTEWLTKWWSELEEDMVRYVLYRAFAVCSPINVFDLSCDGVTRVSVWALDRFGQVSKKTQFSETNPGLS